MLRPSLFVPRALRVRSAQVKQRKLFMTELPKIFDPRAEFVRKVADETGISEPQVRYLISTVGYDHSSLVREPRLLKKDLQ